MARTCMPHHVCVSQTRWPKRVQGTCAESPPGCARFLDRLPCSVSDLPILLVRRSGADNTHSDLRVRRARVLAALQCLKVNNPFYSDIVIDHNALGLLPSDGIPVQLMTVQGDTSELDADSSDGDPPDEVPVDVTSHSFLPFRVRSETEDSAIRATLTGEDAVNWPTRPINKFTTPGLATQSFPALFPYGTGDPTCPSRQRQVSSDTLTRMVIPCTGDLPPTPGSHTGPST